jgi:hypothetical protein
MRYKNLRCFEFSKSFFFLKIGSKNNNKIFNVCTLFSKFEKSDLKNSKHHKILYPRRFQYENFNESEKLKFGDDFIYFLS